MSDESTSATDSRGSAVTRLVRALADRYTIERELGVGGMATVYLAEDIKHKRKVAIKVLKPELAAVLGAERFVQEITTTAALQHPHILPLFDSGESDGFLWYVMPFIDGETLRGKLDRETQLGVDEAIKITTEIADALHYAHTQGIVHRDIKPENILLANGRPMVADFGIALAVSAAAGGRMTETGLSLGTPHYMSPEQATAEKEISARSDVYSLASVLYEMLTGSPPHTGASAQQIIMKIVTEEAAPVTSLRKSVPPNVAAALARALEKLPADRFESARAFGEALKDRHFTTRTGAGTALPSGRSWIRDPRSLVALGTAVILAGMAILGRTGAPALPPGPETIRFTIAGPLDSTFVSMAVRGWAAVAEPVVSPDDRHVAFTVAHSTGPTLYVRALDDFTLREVEPGEADYPFFSPDGKSLGFFKENELWRLDLSENAPTRIGSVPETKWDITAAVWHPDGRILVSGARGLWSVAAATGGEPTLLLPSDPTKIESFQQVTLLPDGRPLLTVVRPGTSDLEVVSTDGLTRTLILQGASAGQIVEEMLIYVAGDQLRATRFDLKSLKPVGLPVTLPYLPAHRFSRSIAWYELGQITNLEPVWVSQAGRATPLGLPVDYYRWPRLSPDGTRLAIGVEIEVAFGGQPLGGVGSSRIATIDLGRRTMAALQGSTEPVWTPDGRRVIQSRGSRPLGGLVSQIADGSRAPDTLLALRDGDSWPTSISADGAWLAYYGASLGSADSADSADSRLATDPGDLYFMKLDTKEIRRIFLPGFQRGGRFSPDMRWVAYESTESGRPEVHVRLWPAMDANYIVSKGGGTEPVWSPDSRTIYFRNRDEMKAVSVLPSAGAFSPGPIRTLFTGTFRHDLYGDQSYDLARDGRFLLLRPVTGGRPLVQVALNWIAEVRARLERGQ